MATYRLSSLARKRGLLTSLQRSFSNIPSLLRPATKNAVATPSYRVIQQSSTTKALSTSPHIAWPHSSTPTAKSQGASSIQKEVDQEPPLRPYSEIPKTKTFMGLNLEVMKDPSRLPEYTEKMVHEVGNIFKMTGVPGLPEMLFVIDPKDVEKVYRLGDQEYPTRLPFNELKQVRDELKVPYGMFLENDKAWHDQRMPISKFIMMPRKMAEYYRPFNEVAFDFMKLIRRKRNEDNLLSDVVFSLNKWSLESVSFFIYGKRLGCLGDEMPPECKHFVDNIHTFFDANSKVVFGLPLHKLWRTKNWKTLVSSFDDLYTYASGQINEKIKEIEEAGKLNVSEKADAELGMDFLTYMIYSGTVRVEEIAVNAIDLLSAGVDTTSVTMAACLYCLANNPDVQDKLKEEVQRVVGDDEIVTPQHIQEMHYLRDCIKETSRMYPIVPNNARLLKEDTVLSGYHIPAGTYVMMPTIVPGRLPEFFPEPTKFKPERWSRDSKEVQNSFTSLPFGFGRRSCVGRRVAELEMHILLAQLMRNFKIEYREDEPIEFVAKLFYGPARQMDLAFVNIK